MSDPIADVIQVQSRRCDREDVEIYAALTADYNPLHLDPEFAAQTAFGHPIVHGTLVLAPIWEALEARIGAKAMARARAEARFLKPVRVGALLRYEGGRVRETGAGAQYEFTVRSEEEGQIVSQVLVCIAKEPS